MNFSERRVGKKGEFVCSFVGTNDALIHMMIKRGFNTASAHIEGQSYRTARAMS
jgi:hypothetical protein